MCQGQGRPDLRLRPTRGFVRHRADMEYRKLQQQHEPDQHRAQADSHDGAARAGNGLPWRAETEPPVR